MTAIEQTKTLVAIANTGWIRSDLALRLMKWEGTFPFNLALVTNRNPVARALNTAVSLFLSTDYTHLWFIDQDILPPEDAPKLLLEAEKPVIGGVFHCINTLPTGQKVISPCVGRFLDSETIAIPRSGPLPGSHPVVSVEMLGPSCALFERSVFENLEPPWFEETVWGPAMSCDVLFMRRLKAKGVPVFAHFGVLCHHLKEIDLEVKLTESRIGVEKGVVVT
jgi:hypothetical protein